MIDCPNIDYLDYDIDTIFGNTPSVYSTPKSFATGSSLKHANPVNYKSSVQDFFLGQKLFMEIPKTTIAVSNELDEVLWSALHKSAKKISRGRRA